MYLKRIISYPTKKYGSLSNTPISSIALQNHFLSWPNLPGLRVALSKLRRYFNNGITSFRMLTFLIYMQMANTTEIRLALKSEMKLWSMDLWCFSVDQIADEAFVFFFLPQYFFFFSRFALDNSLIGNKTLKTAPNSWIHF